MKKIIYQISLITLIIILTMMSVVTNKVEASIAGINCTSATVGGTFTVSFGLPDGASAIEGNIVVTFSDGSQQSGRIVYVPGYSQNGVTFNATVQGTATIQINNIEISTSAGDIMEQGGTASKQITIAGNANNSDNKIPTAPENTTTNKPAEPEPTFTSVNETVYAVQSCNVRESYSTNSNKVGGLQTGQPITRTGIGSNGWSKISYNGKTAYVKTALLTKEEPIIEEPEQSENGTEDMELNERILQLQNEVGVLPEVGNNISIKLYIAVSLISIILVSYLLYKFKKN